MWDLKSRVQITPLGALHCYLDLQIKVLAEVESRIVIIQGKRKVGREYSVTVT
jgi:hypothetical protein